MAKRKAAALPTPVPAFCPAPVLRGSSYRALAQATDRYLAKAEAALRAASMIWSEANGGLETQFDELAGGVFQARHETVELIQELAGDRLGESPL